MAIAVLRNVPVPAKIQLAGCGKRVFGPLSTDEITHYDVFYQAINTEYWGPTLVFPHPASPRITI